MFPNPTSSVSFQGLSFGPEQEGTPFPLGEDKGHFRTVVVITPRSDSLNVDKGKAEICRLFVCNLVRWQLGRSVLLFLSSECYLPSLLFVLGYTLEATLPFWSAVKQIPFGTSQIPLSLPDIQPPPPRPPQLFPLSVPSHPRVTWLQRFCFLSFCFKAEACVRHSAWHEQVHFLFEAWRGVGCGV